ncbi:MAG: alpha,alpha-trehalose-phosphate synthase (UDP-forming) [Acidimicrobiales bacterium]
MTATAELVVASNRGPFSMREEPDGTLRAVRGGGGLAPSLAAALEGNSDAVWIAAGRSEADRRACRAGTVASGQEGLSVRFLDIDEEASRAAYDVIANATLWFVFHGLFDSARRPVFDRVWYEAFEHFRTYNRAFAEAVAETAAPGAVVLVNDYHLLLSGAALARLRPDLRTVHFSHTPFSPPEELEVLPGPVRTEILSSMACFGACGFHTKRWEDSFSRCAKAALGTVPVTFSAGLGADVERLAETASSKETTERLARLEDKVGGRALVLRSDRIELSKNLLRGFRAFAALLEEHRSWHDRVVMVARAYPSRESLPEYLAYRAEVEHLAELVNRRYGTASWQPIMVEVEDDFAASVAALRRYDVLLVNPVRDGMNLVAKEGPALNERDGVLVLSEFAGAYEELGDVALGVHPYDVRQTADALWRALEMAPEERAERAGELARRAVLRSPPEWLKLVLAEARPCRRQGSEP